jgi:hypothetical protein
MAVRGSTSANLGVSRKTKKLSELTLQSSVLISFALLRERGKKKKQANKKYGSHSAHDSKAVFCYKRLS